MSYARVFFASAIVVLAFAVSGCGASQSTDLASCQQAIEKARTIAGVTGDALGVAAVYPPMIGEAAEAGAVQDVTHMKRIAKRMKKATGTLEAQSEQIGVLVDEFNEAAEGCR
jgi:hypothetical protein